MAKRDPFPRDAEGRLINPDYIKTEGERILAQIAARQYGSQPQQDKPIPESPVYTPPVRDPMSERQFGTSFFQPSVSWDQSFGREQNPAQLRNALKLDDLRTIAMQRKLDLEESQRRAPVRAALQDAELAHKLASTAVLGKATSFRQRQDASTMEQISGFAEYMDAAPTVDSPEYAPFVLAGVKKFPRMAATAWGKETLKNIAQEHDTIQDLASRLPKGFDVASISVNSRGRPTLTAKQGVDDKELAEELKTGYKLTLGQIRNPVGAEVGRIDPATKAFVGDPKGDMVRVRNGEGETVSMAAAEYERFGGKYSPETTAAREGKQESSTKPDLLALAQKALADPNASLAHKAAARKLLGN